MESAALLHKNNKVVYFGQIHFVKLLNWHTVMDSSLMVSALWVLPSCGHNINVVRHFIYETSVS